jgi:hypothetical protein
MWSCPKCGVKLVSRNLSHSCGAFSVESFLQGKPPRGKALFQQFVKLVAAAGPYDVAPAKTRVAFLTQVRFASVNRVGDGVLDVHLVFPRRVDSPRFRKVEKLSNLYVHHLRLEGPDAFDDELKGWVKASREEYGERKWLER